MILLNLVQMPYYDQQQQQNNQYFRYNLFQTSIEIGSMIEDCYINKLKDIRERYFPNHPQYQINNRLSTQQSSIISNHEIMIHKNSRPLNYKYNTQQLQGQPISRANSQTLHRQYNTFQAHPSQEKYHGFERSRVTPSQQVIEKQERNTYQSFVKDLESRIIQKQRAISSKLMKESPSKHNLTVPHFKTFTRNNSHRDINQNHLIYNQNTSHDRFIYSRSNNPNIQSEKMTSKIRSKLQQRNNYNTHQNVNSLLNKKYNYSHNHKKLNINGYQPYYMQNSKNATSTLYNHSNRNELVGGGMQDGWSIGKLDVIQHRIKNILRESNK